jgi:hypothetical protein
MTVSGLTMIKTSRQFFQSRERRPEESIPPTQLWPVNFPVEDGQLLTQGEILCREGCSGDDQAPDEQKESGDEDHKSEANHRKKDEPDERAEWRMIPLTASKSTRDGVFGRDRRQRWTWYGYDRQRRKVVAFVNERRTDAACRQLLQKLEDCRITHYRTDKWQSYAKFLPVAE